MRSEDSPAQAPGRLGGCLAITALVALGLFLGLVAGEIGLRLLVPVEPVFVQWDPVLGVRHRPNMKARWYRETRSPVRIQLNSLGFRGPETSSRKPPGTLRVLMLGDSYLEGMQVPLEQLVSRRLEERLGKILGARVEVLNAGVAGWGQAEQSLFLSREGWRYGPDLVISFLYLGNDLKDNWYRTGSPVRPSYEVRDDSLVLHPPHLAPWKVFLRDRILAHLAIPKLIRQHLIHRFEWARLWAARQGLILRNVGKPRSRQDEIQMLDVTQRLYDRMKADCARHGVPLLALEFPYGPQLVGAYPDTNRVPGKLRRDAPAASAPYFYLGEQMASFFARSGIPYVDALPPFAAAAHQGDTLYIGFEGHWTVAGHELAAGLLADYIARHRLLASSAAN